MTDAGRYELTASKTFYFPEGDTVVVAEGGVNGFNFALEPQGVGLIAGRVTFDDTGAPVEGARLLFMRDRQTFSATTDADGRYASAVLEGDYLVVVRVADPDSAFAYTEYYDDARRLVEATVISVAEGEHIEGIDFGVPDLSKLPPPTYQVTVSGRVTDLAGNPIPFATVMVSDFDGFGTPDSTGTYADGRYSVTTRPRSFRLKAWVLGPGYPIQFYDRQPAVYTATPIHVDVETETVEGIDFFLSDENQSGHQIRGTVRADSGQPLGGALVAGYNARTGDVAYTLSDFQGQYVLGELSQDDYYVLALAEDFAPTFYGEAARWRDALQVAVDGVVEDINMRLGGLNRPPIGKGRRLTAFGLDLHLAGTVQRPDAAAAEATLVTLRNDAGEVIGFDLTDAQGFYEIGGVQDGSYVLQADRVGFDEAAETVQVDGEEQMVVRLNLSQASPTPTDEPDELPTILVLGPNFPNPFNPATTLRYTLPQATHVRLVVYDVLGREVAVLIDQQQAAGERTVRFEAPANLPSGVYFYHLQAGNQGATGRMVLLK